MALSITTSDGKRILGTMSVKFFQAATSGCWIKLSRPNGSEESTEDFSSIISQDSNFISVTTDSKATGVNMLQVDKIIPIADESKCSVLFLDRQNKLELDQSYAAVDALVAVTGSGGGGGRGTSRIINASAAFTSTDTNATILVDNTSGVDVTYTFNASPSIGDQISIYVLENQSQDVIVDPGANELEGAVAPYTLSDVLGASYTFEYFDTEGWRLININ